MVLILSEFLKKIVFLKETGEVENVLYFSILFFLIKASLPLPEKLFSEWLVGLVVKATRERDMQIIIHILLVTFCVLLDFKELAHFL